MVSYKVRVKQSAEKELRTISKSDLGRIISRIQALSKDPRPKNVEMLRGQDRYLRLRQGDYRILYEVDDSKKEVLVIKVGHRREVYR